jgi:hypothetical protein
MYTAWWHNTSAALKNPSTRWGSSVAAGAAPRSAGSWTHFESEEIDDVAMSGDLHRIEKKVSQNTLFIKYTNEIF